MNETVKRIVDILFQDTVENDETTALHEELMNNCQEHFRDLVSRGLSEDEAVAEVVESLKGMKDVIAQYPKKSPAAKIVVEEEDKGGAWMFTGADALKAETMEQDIYVSPSADGDIHIYCDDPEGLTCSQTGGTVEIHGARKKAKEEDPFEKPAEGEEISLSGILNMVGNMVGKAIRNLGAVFGSGEPIRIEVPDGGMKELELNTRSGDIRCSCAMALKTTIRSTSGEIQVDPVQEKTADSLTVSTVSGDADVHGSAMEAEISSMSGDVTADGVFEVLRLKSTSGEVEFTGSVTALTASSISGDVEISAENRTLKRVEAKSTSGDVDITLPSGLPGVHAECSTVSGECLSRISDAGSAAPVQVRAKSTSGDVTVQ